MQDKPQPYAALAHRMGLPQTCSLALSGPIEVPETDGGRAWFEAFEEDFELIQVWSERRRRPFTHEGDGMRWVSWFSHILPLHPARPDVRSRPGASSGAPGAWQLPPSF
jgi:hypothetical protein